MDNVKILPIGVVNREDMGTTPDTYCGVMHALEQGADIISMSLGGLGVSPLLNTAALEISTLESTNLRWLLVALGSFRILLCPESRSHINTWISMSF